MGRIEEVEGKWKKYVKNDEVNLFSTQVGIVVKGEKALSVDVDDRDIYK